MIMCKRFQDVERKVITNECGQACDAFKETFGGRY